MKTRQRGAAVIVAMLIVALAATVAAYALQRQHVAVSTLEAGRDHEQARWLLRGGAHWARAILSEDFRANKLDHGGELWASGLPPTEVEHGSLSGEIRDAQGLFNLANLTREGKPSEPDIAALKRLLGLFGLRADLAEAIAAAQPMVQVEELYRVRGFDEQAGAKLARVVTLLPRRTQVNVNTAPAEVLVAIVDGLTLAEALVLAHDRKAAPIRDAGDFLSRLPRRELAQGAEAITVQSRYFVVQGRAKVGRAQARIETLLQRDSASLPVIVWQRLS
jgi:general secretion pathway protein K